MDLVRIATIVIGVWGVGAVAHAQLLSPGPLSRDHASVDGDGNCGRCHESGRRVTASLCNDCHHSVGRSLRTRSGLHGLQYRTRSCGECHVEHRGRSTTLVRWPGGSAERFDHTLSGWALRGAHRRVECEDCHDRRNSRGHRTYFGLRTACVSCHEDPHENRFGRDCTDCHNDTRWEDVNIESFDHGRTRYPLRGAHQRVDCAECHGTPARYRGIAFAQCSDCHEDPHSGRNGPNCAGCHEVSSWSELGAVRENHPGLRLTGGHRNTSCGACHDRGNDQAPSRGSACVSCHRPVHEANLGRRCIQCHASIRWLGLPRRIGLRTHERTAFQLRGEHLETPCQGCHVRSLPRHARYTELVYDGCASCHNDPHSGEFAAREGGECGPCHTERGFSPTTFSVAAHASTSFELEGLHAAVACSGCHENNRPRLDWHVQEQACADCHENPHGDQFATEMRQGGCGQCHNTTGWDRPNIDHSTWPLDGAHSLIACNSCHTPSEADRGTGQGASYRGVPRECGGCHDDEHAGQFRLSEPERACTDCHTTTSFTIDGFDHTRLADYPLIGHHAETQCAGCHAPTELADGRSVTRYRLGYRECRDCHADPHATAPQEGGER